MNRENVISAFKKKVEKERERDIEVELTLENGLHIHCFHSTSQGALWWYPPTSRLWRSTTCLYKPPPKFKPKILGSHWIVQGSWKQRILNPRAPQCNLKVSVNCKTPVMFLSYGLQECCRFWSKNMHNTSMCRTWYFSFFQKRVTDQSEPSSKMKDSNI